jgi:predicted permease
MRWITLVRLRLRSLFRRSRVERDLDDEIQFHLDHLVECHVRRGLSSDEAREAARRSMRGIEARKEECRDARHLGVVDDFIRDLGYGVRLFRRSPVFTAVAVVSLGVGIGANTAIFSVLDSLWWRAVPVPHVQEVFNVRERIPPARVRTEVPYYQFVAFREQMAPFADVAAISNFDRSNVSVSGPPRDGSREHHVAETDEGGRVRVALVSGNYFPMLQLNASIGRTLTPDDDRTPGGHPVAVVSDAFWRRRIAAAPDVLSRTLTLNATTYTIVGVTREGFTGDWIGRPVDIWMPTMMQAQVMIEAPQSLTKNNDYWLRLVGRLRPGTSLDEARARSQVLYQRLMTDWIGQHPDAQALRELAEQRFELEPAVHGFLPKRESLAAPIGILMAVAATVLLVACANVASLLLARSAERQREIALRLAIGASATRLVRQLLTESLLLAGAGGVLGLLFAAWGTRLLSAQLAAGPVQMFWAASSWFAYDIRLNSAALAFTAALCVTTGVLFGLAPAIQAAGLFGRRGAAPSGPSAGLAGRGPTQGAGAGFRLGRILVVAQVALSMVVLLAAGLLVRTLRNLESQDLGFEREHLLLVFTQPTATGRPGNALLALWHDAYERLAALPGVTSASASNGSVLSGYIPAPARVSDPMTIEGQAPRPSNVPGYRSFITPRFFETMGVHLLAGREFTERDTATAPRGVVINETMARHYFGSENPVGRRVTLDGETFTTEIIGVARDFEGGSPRAVDRQQFRTYFSYRDREALRNLENLAIMCVVVRTDVEPRAMAGLVRQALRDVDPALPLLKIDTVDEQLVDVLAQDRLVAGLAGVCGVMAALLACLGLYGLMAHITARRRGEIGVRMALGATPAGAAARVVAEGVTLVVAGIAVGLPATMAARRVLASQLFGVDIWDPYTTGAAISLMLVVAATATAVPARRAAGVDPMVALRCE